MSTKDTGSEEPKNNKENAVIENIPEPTLIHRVSGEDPAADTKLDKDKPPVTETVPENPSTPLSPAPTSLEHTPTPTPSPRASDLKTEADKPNAIEHTAKVFMKHIKEGNVPAVAQHIALGLETILDSHGYLPEIRSTRSRGGDYSVIVPPVKETPLTYILSPELSLTPEQRLALLNLLLATKLDPNRANSLGETPIIQASKINDPTLITRLLKEGVDDLVIRLRDQIPDKRDSGDTKKSADVKSANENANDVSNKTLSDPANIARMMSVINRTTKAMLENPSAYENIFNKNRSLPKRFVSYKFKIPSYFNLAFIGADKIVGIKVIAGYNKEDAETRDDYRDIDFLNEFHPITHRNIAVQVTLATGEKELLTIQTSEDAAILQEVLSDYGFQEELFVEPNPAFTEEQWNLSTGTYTNDTARFYSKHLHPKITQDIQKAIDMKKDKDAIVIEIGAGTGKLSIKILETLSNANSEIHVIGTELIPENMAKAQTNAAKITVSGNNSLDFYQADSTALLQALEKQGVMAEIHTLQTKYLQTHEQPLPIYIAASGALNRLVLNDAFQSTRVMQNIYRLQPEMMVVSGITETLVDQHILKNVGFDTLHRSKDDVGGGGHYYRVKPMTNNSLVEYFNHKLQRKPGRLDLSLNPDPLAIITKIDEKLLQNVTHLDISHAFFKSPVELTKFLEVIHKSCPKLENVVYDFHFPEDGLQMEQVTKKILEENAENRLIPKIKTTLIARDQEIAFSKKFTSRVVEQTYFSMHKSVPDNALPKSIPTPALKPEETSDERADKKENLDSDKKPKTT